MAHWLAELRRRKVHRVLIAYFAATWLLAQVIQFLAEAFVWQPWVLRAGVVVFVLGLPVVAAIAWFFEITSAGLVREKDVPSSAARPGAHDAVAKLAVLPFKPIVAVGRDEALEFGMTDTLITRLSGIHDVVVRPLSSVRRYADLDQDPIAAGRELGVESVLDGSVQKSGQRLRVTARLLCVADGRQLWSERFEEQFEDIFAVQDSIADRVTAALALRLSTAEQQRIKLRPTNDTVAYDLFLNGRYYWNRRASPDDLSRATEFYSRAVARDSRFALAYSGLADALAVQGVFGVRSPQEVYPRALAAAGRALELDQDLAGANAHATRGHIRLSFQHDWQGALDDYDEAIRREPRYAMAHMWRGFRLIFVGHGTEGLAEVQTAKDLEPDSLALAVNHARALYWLRRYGEAEAGLKRVLQIESGNGLARGMLVRVYTQQGQHEAALAQLALGDARSPGSHSFKGVALALAGRTSEARDELQRLTELATGNYVPAYDLAAINTAMGDIGEAFAWLDRAIVEPSVELTTLRVDPVMDRLRGDPRYGVVEKKLRMPPS